MYRSLVVVDDFYAEPLKLRQAALGLAYPEVTGTRTFPGRTSAQPILPQGFDQAIAGLVGERLAPPASPNAFHGHFRITLAGETGRYHVHVDPSGLAWVGVVYLSLPGDCSGGTAFYRHRALGSDRTPTEQAQLDRLGVASIPALLQRDGPDPAAWEHLMTVPMRFNRAIFYRPWLWHSAGPGFGDRPENARLIQLVALRYPQASASPS